MDLLIWWGIRGYINEFRKRKLKLPPIAYLSMYHGSISHLPTGYMWSPHLVPKPSGKNSISYTVANHSQAQTSLLLSSSPLIGNYSKMLLSPNFIPLFPEQNPFFSPSPRKRQLLNMVKRNYWMSKTYSTARFVEILFMFLITGMHLGLIFYLL